uniref:Uncharacterized protein n=1 Tax=Rhizophora mucronata TaxID=61149 RepID=A0A2P2N7U1_RHIMU
MSSSHVSVTILHRFSIKFYMAFVLCLCWPIGIYLFCLVFLDGLA